MRILVTGAFGFVGRAVVRRLAGDGHEVWALTHRPEGSAVPDLPAAQVRHADVRDQEALRPALDGVAAVCHLAALTNSRTSLDRPEAYREVNLGGTTALLDALASRPGGGAPPVVVLGSTAAVYGAPDRQPITEETVPAPGNPYGASKLDAEELLRQRAAAGEVSAVILRCFNVGGTGDVDEARIIPKALAVAAGRHPYLELTGDGGTVRDFVHVDDVAQAYALAVTGARPGLARTYNVGATPASMLEIVQLVERITGRPVPIVHRPAQPEAPRLVADTSLITRELGWRAERSALEQLIRDAWSAQDAT
ncbi:UDP-glucose 4-epimerase GalE [Kitasatospora atroaurantiaca]|uniref:UDP-glucose 4-epimerase n=1 Tax=Kitasatospora atroaurantiaca TaxID=285545 RepID=A0A561EKF0_9ACTN|nr:NAD-dependent epimerase/dehydratase family protein [Kitasatospora atroaurantiaca]TWE16097.1 UDP-glucose 4-epimerase [Kitasatospora atroaurantiaca]